MPLISTLANASSRGYRIFAAGEINSYESIATTTVGSGGTSTITFSSIPSTYTHLQVRISAQASTTTEQSSPIYISLNSDNTYSNYRYHLLRGNGSAVAGVQGQFPIIGQIHDKNSSTNTYSGLVVDFLDYANTNKYKTLRTLWGGDVNDTWGLVGLQSTLWINTSAVTSISMTVVGGTSPLFTEYSKFALYGIKG
jgi:hypothetical protein